MSSLTPFRSIRPRRKLKIEPLTHVIAQMQGLLDTDPDPENATEMAFRGLVESWHNMLQSAVVEEAKQS